MTGEEDQFFSDLRRTDPWIAAITPERIERALEGFQLPFAEGWDFERLAFSIQDMADSGRGDPPQGDADAIKELKDLERKARQLHRGITRMGETAEIAAFWEVTRHLTDGGPKTQVDYEADYKPFMLHPLDAIANILARAASQMGTQRKQTTRWREKHGQDQRVGFAIFLSPIFRSAFETPALANNWGQEYGEEHPWPDFYRRIYKALFPKVERLNLSKVLQEAARLLPHVEEMRQWRKEQDAIRAENKCE